MNSPPVRKIKADEASSNTAIGETLEPAATNDTATPPSPATAVTLSGSVIALGRAHEPVP